MDIKNVKVEVDQLIKNLDDEDERTKEYQQIVTNARILHQMELNQDEYDLKKSHNDFEEKMAAKKFSLEKKKFEIDVERMRMQHDERMAEIEVNKIKAENEKIILKQNQIKQEKEFKSKFRHDWIEFGIRVGGLLLIVGVNVLMHKDELRFERDENGIVPRRCNTYDAITIKASETLLR